MDDYYKTLDEKSLSQIKSYSESIMTCMKMFEKVQEWADLMKALDKLQSVFFPLCLFYFSNLKNPKYFPTFQIDTSLLKDLLNL